MSSLAGLWGAHPLHPEPPHLRQRGHEGGQGQGARVSEGRAWSRGSFLLRRVSSKGHSVRGGGPHKGPSGPDSSGPSRQPHAFLTTSEHRGASEGGWRPNPQPGQSRPVPQSPRRKAWAGDGGELQEWGCGGRQGGTRAAIPMRLCDPRHVTSPL